LGDFDVAVVLDADVLMPSRSRSRRAPVALEHRPRTRKRMIDDRNLIVQNHWIGCVEIDPLLYDRLIVPVERKTRGLECARTLELARLDFEHVVAPVTVLVDPLADGIAGI